MPDPRTQCGHSGRGRNGITVPSSPLGCCPGLNMLSHLCPIPILGQGAKKGPGPIFLPSPWHISSQARLGCRQEAAGSSRDVRMQDPAAGISGDPSPELGNLQTTGLEAASESLPALVTRGLTLTAPPLAVRAGRQRKEGRGTQSHTAGTL